MFTIAAMIPESIYLVQFHDFKISIDMLFAEIACAIRNLSMLADPYSITGPACSL
jgi:hypothetical protein